MCALGCSCPKCGDDFFKKFFDFCIFLTMYKRTYTNTAGRKWGNIIKVIAVNGIDMKEIHFGSRLAWNHPEMFNSCMKYKQIIFFQKVGSTIHKNCPLAVITVKKIMNFQYSSGMNEPFLVNIRIACFDCAWRCQIVATQVKNLHFPKYTTKYML